MSEPTDIPKLVNGSIQHLLPGYIRRHRPAILAIVTKRAWEQRGAQGVGDAVEAGEWTLAAILEEAEGEG